jgi:hypothetical protein
MARSSRSKSGRPAAETSRRRRALRRRVPGRRLHVRSPGAPAFPGTQKRSAAVVAGSGLGKRKRREDVGMLAHRDHAHCCRAGDVNDPNLALAPVHPAADLEDVKSRLPPRRMAFKGEVPSTRCGRRQNRCLCRSWPLSSYRTVA